MTQANELHFDIAEAYEQLPKNWFLWSLKEKVKPQIYKGDRHDPIGWICQLQNRGGGRITTGEDSTPSQAFRSAVDQVRLLIKNGVIPEE